MPDTTAAQAAAQATIIQDNDPIMHSPQVQLGVIVWNLEMEMENELLEQLAMVVIVGVVVVVVITIVC